MCPANACAPASRCQTLQEIGRGLEQGGRRTISLCLDARSTLLALPFPMRSGLMGAAGSWVQRVSPFNVCCSLHAEDTQVEDGQGFPKRLDVVPGLRHAGAGGAHAPRDLSAGERFSRVGTTR